MNDQEQISPRRRLQMLLAISDYDRTEEEWEELAELEISLSPSNRVGGPEPASNHSPAGRKRTNNKPVNKTASPQRKSPRKPRGESKPEPKRETATPSEPAQATDTASAAAAGAEATDKPAGGPKRGFRRTPRRRSGNKPGSGSTAPGTEAPKSDSSE